jgi:hypothetical protein
VAGPSGLFVSVLFYLRPAHPPLFIPWADVRAEVHCGWVYRYIYRYVDFRFRRHPTLRVRLSEGLAERLLAAGGQRMPSHETR